MSANTNNTSSWVLGRPQVTWDTQLTAGEGESHRGHTPECGRGRKPHEVYTLVRGRAISLVMKNISLIRNGFLTDCTVFEGVVMVFAESFIVNPLVIPTLVAVAA